MIPSGGIAQLVEHDTGSVGVRGSNPLTSTTKFTNPGPHGPGFLVCVGHVEGTVSMDHFDSTRRELFYWATIIATFALGTALGDDTAVTVKLGYGGSIFLFAAAFALPALWWGITRRGEIACFWLAYIVTRPLGASVADYLAMPHHCGGLNFGLGNISLVWLILIALGVAAMAQRARSVTP